MSKGAGLILLTLVVGIAVSCRGTGMKAKDFFEDKNVAELAEAASRGDAAGVEAARRAGASPNAEGKQGITPILYVLSSTRNKAGLRALLQAGADPNKISAGGMCPTILAARAEDPEFLKIMLEGGGDANIKDDGKNPVLQIAADGLRWENVRQLVAHGADLNAGDANGFTVSMNLIAQAKYEQVAWLIESGADVRAKSKNGYTLADCVKNGTLAANSPQVRWRNRVIELLHEKGVELPK